jgi:antitoxin ParD1/3/4
MATMNISLEEDLKEFASGPRVRERGFSSVSEYIRHLVRVDRELDRLRALVEEGLASGHSEPFAEDHLEGLRQRVRRGSAG